LKATYGEGDRRSCTTSMAKYSVRAVGTVASTYYVRSQNKNSLPMAQKLQTSAQDSTAQIALHKAKGKPATYYNRNARERRPLEVGVMHTRWNRRRPWTKSEVVRVLPYRSYNLRYKNGTVCRRTSKRAFLAEAATRFMYLQGNYTVAGWYRREQNVDSAEHD